MTDDARVQAIRQRLKFLQYTREDILWLLDELQAAEARAASAEQILVEVHVELDEVGIEQYSAADEMPPDVELTIPERVRRLRQRLALAPASPETPEE